MKELIILAWRNIWRNKRRSLLTMASILFAVFFAIIMRSIQLGTYGHMIQQSIEKYSGYLQIQEPEYFDEPSLDNALQYSDSLLAHLSSHENVKIAVPRIESFVLASTGTQSKGVMVTGIDVEKEHFTGDPESNLVHYQLSPAIVAQLVEELQPNEKIQKLLELHTNDVYHDLDRIALDLNLKEKDFMPYRTALERIAKFESSYLKPDDDGVLVSYRLSRFLNARVGDTLVLMGSGYHGASAAGLFPVRGIVKMASPELDNKIVYMTLARASELFDMQGHITTISINLHQKDALLSTQQELQAMLPADAYAVRNWKEVNAVLVQQIEGDDKSGQMFIGILYFIIFFGIIGTVMMMLAERKREFGVLVAIGMRKRKLASIVLIEMVFMGIIGTLLGILTALPPVLYFYYHPVRFTGEMGAMYEDMGIDPLMPAAPIESYFTWQALIIMIMVVLACYIPLKRIRKMEVMTALRG